MHLKVVNTIRNLKLLCLFLSIISQQTFPLFSYSSIQQAITNRKTALYGLAGMAMATAVTTQLLATDYGSVQADNADYYWNWDAIDATSISFDDSFIFGVGTSAYQVEGDCTNTDWHQWEHNSDESGAAYVQHRSGIACDHWNKYKEDITLLKELGVDIYRFSLAWDKIEPRQGQFDEQAIDHYKDVCNELKKHNIKALIGFHHYTDPQWFAQLGGFEKEENIPLFVAYCTKVFQAFHDAGIMVDMWSIFNSPSGYAFHKYHVGDFPPGIKNNKPLTITVIKNMMEAHVQVYQKAKKIDPTFYIGFLHNIMIMDPWRPWHPLDTFACAIATDMTDTCIFNFFTTGTFKAKIPFDNAPFMVNIEHTNNKAPYSVDFIGLNYYSHSYIKNMKRLAHPQEISTENINYTIYPEGLYRAIVTITQELKKPMELLAQKEIPLYVTENGIAHENEAIRKLFFKRYLYALHKAINNGYPVNGYIYWSFMDNYEWGSYDKKYGLVYVDFNHPDLPRTIKTDAGTQYLISCMRKNRSASYNYIQSAL